MKISHPLHNCPALTSNENHIGAGTLISIAAILIKEHNVSLCNGHIHPSSYSYDSYAMTAASTASTDPPDAVFDTTR